MVIGLPGRLVAVCLVGALLLVLYSCLHGQSRASRSSIVMGNVLNTEATLSRRHKGRLPANGADNAFLCSTNGNVVWRYRERDGAVSVMGVDFVGGRGCDRLEVPSAIGGARVCEIGPAVFRRRKGLVEVRLPDSVWAIGDFAFADCAALRRFHAPRALERMGDCLFVGCAAMSTVRISERVSSIGAFAFLGCGALKGFEVDPDNRSFMARDGVLLSRDEGELICYPSGKVEQRYSIPPAVRVIRKGAFVDCAHLVRVFVPEGVSEIGDWNFYACRRLKAVFMSADGHAKLGLNVPMKVLRHSPRR